MIAKKRMPIKKRLFISNILMLVIPIFIGGTVTSIAMFLSGYWDIKKHDNFSGPIFGSILMMAVIIGSVLLLNTFLTRFVFQRIKKALDTLTDGVRNIHAGNLNYSIDYQDNDEFKPVCDAFNEMALKLKQSEEETKKNEENRKELFAGISHDLRSPLASIRMFAEGLLENVAVTEEAKTEYLRTIINKADELTDRVNSLFMFSKMDMGDYPFHPEKINVQNIITELVEATKIDYHNKGVIFNNLNLQENLCICGDPLQFNSIFANIIDNSEKYKIENTVEVDIITYLKNDIVVITFEDNGPGVPQESLNKLFDVFYRSDVARTNTNKGSGLGLAIVRKAVERMNGVINAEISAKGGLKIIIEIPQYLEPSELSEHRL